MVEMIPHVQSENGRLSDESHLNTWWTSYSRILTQMGKNVRIGRDLERMLSREGFDQVQGRVYNLPIGTLRPMLDGCQHQLWHQNATASFVCPLDWSYRWLTSCV